MNRFHFLQRLYLESRERRFNEEEAWDSKLDCNGEIVGKTALVFALLRFKDKDPNRVDNRENIVEPAIVITLQGFKLSLGFISLAWIVKVTMRAMRNAPGIYGL
ncbi:hypothetical protein HS088_TW09G01333 [Tripterygium wilfordii]|uniref:Uncharacterized protein n=1 Tax=Tripterygium wilfordii TaxID=458696 RepID=A0A7J7DA85_TRIWF|nr:hypothetical protein HS088_TW09G01333 [Tripterygium wilfordii]